MTDETIPTLPIAVRTARPAPLAIASFVSVATALGLGAFQLIDPAQAKNIPTAFGTVAGWISAGGIMGILSLLVWWQLGNRKIKVEEVGVNVAAIAASDKIHAAEREDIRDHYAAEVTSLRTRIDEQAERHATRVADLEARYLANVAEVEKRYAGALSAAEERHRECEKQRDDLGIEVRKLRDDIAGLERKLLTQSSDRVLAIGMPGQPEPSPAVKDAARRVRRIARERGGTDKPGGS